MLTRFFDCLSCSFNLYVFLQPRNTRDQDLRSLLRRRRAVDAYSSGKVEGEVSDDEGDEVVSRGSIASVVRLPDKQPR